MDLERVAAVIRPRRPWEAVDLGFTLVQAWRRQIWGPWLVVALPLWLAVLLATRRSPYLGYALLWWTKPLLDVIPLHVVSRALFGETPTLRATLRHALRSWRRMAPAYLGLERLDPARSFHLPVRLLEELSWGERWRRQGVLNRDGHRQAILLTLACLGAQVFLLFAFFAFVFLMVPEGLAPDWSLLFDRYVEDGEAPLAYHLLWGMAAFAALTVVEPFYVAAGFTLYLNRRTELEGWDVEIAFRRLARRLTQEAGARPGKPGAAAQRGVAAALLLGALVLGALPASAVPPTAAGPTAAPAPATETGSPQQVAERVLAGPDFGRERTTHDWKWRFGGDGQGRRASGRFSLSWVGPFLEAGLWLLLGAGVAALLVFAVRRRGFLARGSAPPVAPLPLPIAAGTGPNAEPLPADVAAEALRRFEAGRSVEALSLLYRGALRALAARRGIEVDPSWTEGECLRRLVQQVSPPTASELERLTRAWQGAAYARRPVPGEEMRSLCAEFGRHFGAGAR